LSVVDEPGVLGRFKPHFLSSTPKRSQKRYSWDFIQRNFKYFLNSADRVKTPIIPFADKSTDVTG
jgi:hypothetical protein